MARNLIRIASTDIDSSLGLQRALMKIKGVSFSFSNGLIKSLALDPKKKIGDLSKDEIKKIEDAIRNPSLPRFMLNRRKDPESGKDTHLSGTIIDIKLRSDIDNLRRIRAYRGIRHELGLPVRGQRTKSSFRKNKISKVGRRK